MSIERWLFVLLILVQQLCMTSAYERRGGGGGVQSVHWSGARKAKKLKLSHRRFFFFIFVGGGGYWNFKLKSSIWREVSIYPPGPKAVLFALQNFSWRPCVWHYAFTYIYWLEVCSENWLSICIVIHWQIYRGSTKISVTLIYQNLTQSYMNYYIAYLF